jgi:hypothetical protein
MRIKERTIECDGVEHDIKGKVLFSAQSWPRLLHVLRRLILEFRKILLKELSQFFACSSFES